MKLLLNDVVQGSDAPDALKSPALADYYSDAVSKNLVLAGKSTIDCIGVGHTDATEVYIKSRSAWISQAYTNLVQDNCDLRASGANWTALNTTDELSTLSINGNLFTKVVNSGAIAGYNKQTFTTSFTNLILTGSTILKKGSTTDNTARLQIFNSTAPATIFSIVVDWDNYRSAPAVATPGMLLDYDWIDSETLKLYFKCDALANLTDTIFVACYASPTATAGEYTYWSEVQLIDSSGITMFPFVNGTHAADVINETVEMQDKFAVRLRLEPRFAFDTTVQQHLLKWNVDADSFLRLYYHNGGDYFALRWKDNSNIVELASQVFDDGTLHTNINQPLDIIAFLNLSSGGINDSMFIVIPQKSGAIFTDNSLSASPDIKSSNFPTLNIGYDGSSRQADSEIEYLRMYSWDGVKPTITNSNDADAYFATQTKLFEWRGFPLINGGIYPETIELADTDTNGLYELDNEIYSDEVTVSHNGTYIGRVALGESKTMYASPSREPGFWTTNLPRKTLSGQIIAGAGGVSGRLLQLKFLYKFTADIFADIELAWAEQLSRGYPVFIYFDNESHNIPWLRLYANFGNANGDDFILQNSIWKALYSKTVELREAF